MRQAVVRAGPEASRKVFVTADCLDGSSALKIGL
jgi:hypothetical protein